MTKKNQDGIIAKIIKNKNSMYNTFKKRERRVLVIGDLHAPFIRDGYLKFCKDVYKEYKCNSVIFLGDIVDNHASSFHTTDPDGLSAKDELEMALKSIKKWTTAFPVAKVCIGNHDRLPRRKAFESGVSTKWVKDYSDVLKCNGWDFQPSFQIDNVIYEHGEGQKPHIKMLRNRRSSVCGHIHSELSVRYSVSQYDKLFAMQIGWGGDQDSFSMAYAKNQKRGVLSCGVVLKNGTLPIPISMPIG